MRTLGLLAWAVLRICTGDVREPMVVLGSENFPGRHARVLHLIMFYSPYCAHCQTVEPHLLGLADALRGEDDIVVGAIDCTNTSNQAVCRQHNITGYPSIFAIGWRHMVQYSGAASESQIVSWFDKVRSRRSSRSSGGSVACPHGLFQRQKSVVPLCVDHYPDETAKHPWLVVLYKMQQDLDLQEPVTSAARDLGRQGGKKQRERLQSLAHRYNFEVNEAHVTTQGLETGHAFAKVGALCCDCRQDEKVFCKDLQKSWRSQGLPLVLWMSKDGQEVLQSPARLQDITARDLVRFALSRLGYISTMTRPRPASQPQSEL